GTVRRSKTTVEGGNFGSASRTSLRSSGPAKSTERTESLRSSIEASSAKRSMGQRRLGCPAPGKMPTSGPSPDARDLAHAERRQHVQVTVDGVLRAVFDGRRGLEVCEVVERAPRPPC